jgi:hypothetical protein
MDGLDGDNMLTPTVTSRNSKGAVFSVRGRCRRFITYGKPLTGCGGLEI